MKSKLRDCYECGGSMKKGGKWIQKAVKSMRKDKPCTGAKFGSSSCPPGSKRYNLAKTFKSMGRKRKKGNYGMLMNTKSSLRRTYNTRQGI